MILAETEYWMALSLLIGGFIAYKAVEFVAWLNETLKDQEAERADFESRKRV